MRFNISGGQISSRLSALLARWRDALRPPPHNSRRRTFYLGASALALTAACATYGGAPPPPPPPPPTPPPPPSPTDQPGRTNLPNFPWPPPRPSDQVALPTSLFAADVFGQVNDRITSAMRVAGYAQASYYRVPGGFAIVARLERIDDDAYPRRPDSERFLSPSAQEANNPLSFIHDLFFAPEGSYRQVVFVVTDKPLEASAPPPTAIEAAALLENGAVALPESYRRVPMSAQHRVHALIYEFRKLGNATASVRRPGRWNANTHLERAGLRRALERR